MSKITDLIALDQLFGRKKGDGMCIGGNQALGITHTISFKTMTTIKTDHSNTELLDQELTAAELSEVSGSLLGPIIAGISILLGQKPPVGHTIDTIKDAVDGTIGTPESRVNQTKVILKKGGLAPLAN
ncbi:MAG: hypothetical protein AB8A34_06575 [Prochlorococcus sp.]